MTTKIIFGSNKLGELNEAIIEQMLYRFHLGKLVSAKRTSNGAMGQTMFIQSTKGEFVLKGNPLFPGQFEEERFYIENLAKKTMLALPTPYIIDFEEDLTGWSYVLMPRKKGTHLNDNQKHLSEAEESQIVREIAKVLAEMHQWKTPIFGEYKPLAGEVHPFESSYFQWLKERILYWLGDAKKYSTITELDEQFALDLIEQAKPVFDSLKVAEFVMGDFKVGNFVMDKISGQWKVSGIFDFTNAYFADGSNDLVKMFLYYIEKGKQSLVHELFNSYVQLIQKDTEQMKKRLTVHMLHQRVLDWGCFKAIGAVTWDDSLSFSEWVQPYVMFVEDL
ncbi:phosphotransferase family protein [Alkalihalobacillus sp. 1P02AB]|uniref:phosphotransferase family protein n=1 Tax=Alkalihalobacillus sp. 1P02AB TaxID=3132260 RepID=UPI0039A61E5F